MAPMSRSEARCIVVACYCAFRAMVVFFGFWLLAYENGAVFVAIRKTPNLRVLKDGNIIHPIMLLATIMSSFVFFWSFIAAGLFCVTRLSWAIWGFIGEAGFAATFLLVTIYQARVLEPIPHCGNANSTAFFTEMANANNPNKTTPVDQCSNFRTSFGLNIAYEILQLIGFLLATCAICELAMAPVSHRLRPLARPLLIFLSPFSFITRIVLNKLHRCRSQSLTIRKNEVATVSNHSETDTFSDPHIQQLKGTVVHLRELHFQGTTECSAGHSPFENLVNIDDIFFLISRSCHGVDIERLSRVSTTTRSVVARNRDSNPKSLRFYCDEVNDDSSKLRCRACKIRICPGCSTSRVFDQYSTTAFALTRLRPVCSYCYFRCLCTPARNTLPYFFNTMGKKCDCRPVGAYHLVCNECSQRDREYYAAILEREAREEYPLPERCAGCHETLWKYRVRWWGCKTCEREDCRTNLA